MAYGQTASGKSHTMGVLQGVDIAGNDGASLSAAEASGFDDTDDSPHARSRVGGSRRSGEEEPRVQGYGKPNGAQNLHSHNQDEPGIIPRALSRVFQFVQGSADPFGSELTTDVSPEVRVSLLQIYNETIQVHVHMYMSSPLLWCKCDRVEGAGCLMTGDPNSLRKGKIPGLIFP